VGNLTKQVRAIAEVIKAVALGDLSKKVQVDAQGEMLDLKVMVNAMVDWLSTLANEITRVSLEVGTEGILGGQATVPHAQGTWKVRTDNRALHCEQRTDRVYRH
jgi:osomolarity two-component system sensor histidine kinase NIK1